MLNISVRAKNVLHSSKDIIIKTKITIQGALMLKLFFISVLILEHRKKFRVFSFETNLMDTKIAITII